MNDLARGTAARCSVFEPGRTRRVRVVNLQHRSLVEVAVERQGFDIADVSSDKTGIANASGSD